MKIWTDVQQTGRHTDSQRDTIIPLYFHVAGYKKGKKFNRSVYQDKYSQQNLAISFHVT